MDREPRTAPAIGAAAVVPVPAGGAMDSSLLRNTWALAWPVIVTYLLESLVGLIDMVMVGRLGADAVAAVGVGAQVLSAVSVAMTAVGTGTLALVARHVGAREPRAAENVLVQSILTAFFLSVVVIAPVIAFAPAIVRAFGVSAAVAEPSAAFVRLAMLSIPQSAALFAIGSGLRAAGDTRTPLFVGSLVNLVNIAGNYVLIFGKLGLPALGVRGSALATTLAFTVGLLLALTLLGRGGLVLRPALRRARLEAATVRRVLAVGYPAAGEQILMQIGFFVYLAFAARYGTSALAGYFIGVRILALSFLPGFGFAAAAGALVGQNLGARNPTLAERSGWMANRLAVALMSAGGVVLYLTAEPIARLFVADAEVVADAVAFIHALAISQPLMAVDFTLGGALRGAGDTKFPLLSVLISFYGCRLIWAYTVTHVLHLTLPWLWAAILGDYLARAVLKSWRFRSGRWKHVVV